VDATTEISARSAADPKVSAHRELWSRPGLMELPPLDAARQAPQAVLEVHEAHRLAERRESPDASEHRASDQQLAERCRVVQRRESRRTAPRVCPLARRQAVVAEQHRVA
jgi:hypothetical protein